MTTLQWKESYMLGVENIDNQHRHIFDLLDQLKEAVGRTGSEIIVGRVIKDLVQHAQVHFRDEEKLMEEVGYHDIRRHKELHHIYIDRIVQILRRLKAGQEVTPADLAEFLERWMVDHLLGEDVKIAFAVKAAREKAATDR